MRQVAEQGLLEKLTAERVGSELLKALEMKHAGRFLEIIDSAGCLEPWFKELSKMSLIPAGPAKHHASHCLGHTVRVMNECPNAISRYMALCHDLGKQETVSAKLPHHFGHDKRGEQLANSLGRRLKLSHFFIKAGCIAARHHMKAGHYNALRPRTKVDLLTLLHKARVVAPFFSMVKADSRNDFYPEAQLDLKKILLVTLPPELQNLGEESGRRLHEMRCMTLSSNKKSPEG